jgi:hypothetical protein
LAAKAAGLAAKAVFTVIPGQGNQFAFAIHKRDELKPWIAATARGNVLDPNYKLSFDPAKYQKEDWDKREKNVA